MPDKNYLERITRYEEGQMNEAERKAFEEALVDDTALRETQADYKAAQLVVDQMAYEELKSRLRKMEEKPARRLSVYWRIAAACVLLLIAAIIVLRLASGADTPPSLAQAFYEPPAMETVRSTSSDEPENKLADAWQSKDYADIIEELKGIEISLAQRMLLAHTHYALQDWGAAIIQFSAVIDAADPRYSYTAHWYRALCYLQTEELSKSKADLRIVVENASPGLRQKGETLLQRIER